MLSGMKPEISLSEAIRLGSMMKRQGYGYYREEVRASVMGIPALVEERTCALGAAADAVGRLDEVANDDNVFEVVDVFGILGTSAACPVCGAGGRRWDMSDVIPHLNDDHRWTRERIAEWVEGVEMAVDGSRLGEEVGHEIRI